MEAGFGDTILRRFINAIDRNNPEADPAVRTSNMYISGCLYAIISQWILDDMKTDVKVIASTCTKLLFHGIDTTNMRKYVID